MSETISAPVAFKVHDDGEVSLTFGPMPMDDLAQVLVNLGTEDGQRSFLTHLNDALKKEVGRE